TGNQIVYQYDTSYNYSDGYAQIKSVSEYNSSSALGQMIGFEYSPETTTVKTSGNDDAYGTADDLHTHYVFDDHGRTISAYTTDKNKTQVYGASNAEYSPTEQGSKKNHTITKDSVSGVPAVNLIENSSMESSGSWSGHYSGTGYSSDRSTEQKYIGSYSYKFTSTTTKDSGFYDRRQSVTVTEEGNYTLSAYVRVESLNATTGFYLELGGVSSRKLKTNTNATIQNGWQRISVTAYLTAGTYDARLILQKSIGTVYVDCVQLEKADGASSYNLLNNGSFTDSTSGWTTSGASYASGRIKLTGSPTATKTAYQTVPVNLPLTTTFVLSGWAEAYSVGRRIPENVNTTPERNYDLVATLTYSNGTTEDTAVSFSTDSAALQFASGAVVSKKTNNALTITSIKVAIHYDYNANTAYFDNICLAMEPAQTYLYDSEGNLTSATNAEGNKIGAEYSADGVDITSYTNIVGQKYNYYYESGTAHVVSTITATGIDSNKINTTYSYDQYGNVKGTTVSSLNFDKAISSSSTSDAYGKTTQTVDERGNVTNYSYNNATELLNYVQNANGARTHYDYDGKDRITAIFNDVDKDGVKDTTEETVAYAYNTKNQLASIETDTVEYSLIYNSFGAQSEIKAGNKTLATYAYNSKNGKLDSTSYGNGFAVTNVYDELDRLVEVNYTVNNIVTITAYTVSYNGDGNVDKVVDNRSGITTEYEYDSLGRLIHATEYETSTKNVLLNTENEFDSYGRPEMSFYDLPDLDIKYNVYYKANTNIISSYRQSSSIDGFNPNKKVYTYDALERVTKIEYRYNNTVVFTENYTYVNNGNQTTNLVATHTVDGDVYSYTYDAVGNITLIKKNGVNKYSYTYDNLGQLIQENIYSDNYAEDSYADIYIYLYDKSGNITERRHYADGSLSTDGATYTYSTGTWGDLLRWYNGQEITYDTIGNPIKWRNADTIEWQGRQLSLIAHTEDAITDYVYNADGIRTGKQYLDAGGGVIGTVKYTLDGNKIVAENRNGTNIYYTYDDKGAIMGMIYGGQDYIFSKNLQGDVIGIYNSSRQLVAKYTYNAYGEITAITNASGVDVSNN
ncbi:MAG: RHS repeat protein, partial [Clostridia bacterium]|nr:RHS repeat protein [Clostridia bacterium]